MDVHVCTDPEGTKTLFVIENTNTAVRAYKLGVKVKEMWA
jgi:hypothetical protein